MAIKTTDEMAPAERIYQYFNGSFLPDSSQPIPQKGYRIAASQYTPHKVTRYLNISTECSDVTQAKDGKGEFCASQKGLPILYTNRTDCCGCSACHAICPGSAILMRPDEEGFLYPVVDAKKCLRCYQCIDVCPIKRKNLD